MTACRLAESHDPVEPGLTAIFRLISPREDDEEEPVKLLEVSESTTTGGILPDGRTLLKVFHQSAGDLAGPGAAAPEKRGRA